MKIRAIVLKSIPVREYDRLVICYTAEAGKHAYQARGSARHSSIQARHLEPFNLVDFSVVEARRQPIIVGAASVRSYSHLKRSLPALAAGFFVLECFDKLVFDGQVDSDLWHYLTNTLESFDADSHNPATDWHARVGDAYRGLLAVMGYHGDSSMVELGHANFNSLRFFNEVARRSYKLAPVVIQ
jgi:DNA repair protein RecO